VIHLGENFARKLSELENKDELVERLRKQLATAGDQYLQLARSISKKRFEAAKKLEKRVEAASQELAMKARFRIELSGSDNHGNWTAHGLDQAEYMISTNPGEPLHLLDQIASGGELARVMLALKASVESGSAQKAGPRVARTLVFDEIDAGIGGRAADAVGKKLKELARAHQTICVTHLPQIAIFADHHYVIEKQQANGRTRTTVRKISGEERTEEIARMLSGAKLTDTSLKHAEQMIKSNA
jgi:DNA repair protein RecN (Recombination protein N)